MKKSFKTFNMNKKVLFRCEILHFGCLLLYVACSFCMFNEVINFMFLLYI